ncbi:MAG: 30S ribosomal protein S6 [Pseudomonadota bacterium]
MALYECVFIARQDIGSSQAQALIEEFTKIIEDNGGSVPKNEYWGLKTLSYRIKKNRKGHYILLNLDAPHEAVAELERQMGLNEDVLRSLVVRVEELEEGPSVMMQSRGRDDRGGRRGPRDRDRDRGPRDREQRDGDRAPAGGDAAPAEAAEKAEKAEKPEKTEEDKGEAA